MLLFAAIHVIGKIDPGTKNAKHEWQGDLLGLINISPQTDGLTDLMPQTQGADRGIQEKRKNIE